MVTDYLSLSIENARLQAAQFQATLENDACILQRESYDRYQQKGDFDVLRYDFDEWLIAVPSPFFLPDSPVADFLERGYFKTCKVDDECALVVSLKEPINSVQDEDYIREAFDIALAWYPKYQLVEKAFIKWQNAKDAYEVAKKNWEAAQGLLVA